MVHGGVHPWRPYRLLTGRGVCRYFQELVDAEFEFDKAKGIFTTGVQFVNEGAEMTGRDIIWRHPLPNHGEVRPLGLHTSSRSNTHCCRALNRAWNGFRRLLDCVELAGVPHQPCYRGWTQLRAR
jgi:hypothetical protein